MIVPFVVLSMVHFLLITNHEGLNKRGCYLIIILISPFYNMRFVVPVFALPVGVDVGIDPGSACKRHSLAYEFQKKLK